MSCPKTKSEICEKVGGFVDARFCTKICKQNPSQLKTSKAPVVIAKALSGIEPWQRKNSQLIRDRQGCNCKDNDEHFT
ncbi:MAG: hypothetical protein JEZ07_20240 [Phycisphaerae bacterium]|nr:hypothetical protein [Phycisphaerae bacterium]MBI9019587.1 hypothetical protein [Phycisphaerae bacterium]